MHGIEAVLAHPQALAQCQNWLNKHLPDVERRAVSSNAEGARLAADQPGLGGPGQRPRVHASSACTSRPTPSRTRPTTAPASPSSACRRPWPRRPPPGRDCTSLVVSVPNRPGAMHDLLVPLKTHGVSMTRLESRPARTGQWDYYFYIDLDGHPSQSNVAAALRGTARVLRLLQDAGRLPREELRPDDVPAARRDRMRPDGRQLSRWR